MPDGLERNAKLAVVVNNIRSLAPVVVTPAALVETKAPVRLHRRQADDAGLVLLCDLLLSWTVEKVQINAATKRSPGQVRRKHESFHGMSVALVDTVAATNVVALSAGILRCHKRVLSGLLIDLVVSGVEIEWVVAIDVACHLLVELMIENLRQNEPSIGSPASAA